MTEDTKVHRNLCDLGSSSLPMTALRGFELVVDVAEDGDHFSNPAMRKPGQVSTRAINGDVGSVFGPLTFVPPV